MGMDPWRSGSLYVNNVNVYMQATGSQAIEVPYTVVVTNTAYQNVTGSWNWEVSCSLKPACQCFAWQGKGSGGMAWAGLMLADFCC